MIAGLLLAAGGSTRFGSQKLVADFRGQPLVAYAARTLRDATDEALAVIGNDAALVRAAIEGAGVSLVENPDWADGLSTSLQAGVAALPADADAVLVVLGDQPLVDAALLAAIVAEWRESGAAVVAARFRGVVAPPVLLSRAVFGEVAELRGDVGAKPLIHRVPSRVAYVDVDAEVPRDVDTRGDLASLDSDRILDPDWIPE